MLKNFTKYIKKYKWVFLLVIVIIFIIIYKIFDPYEVDFYPKCVFHSITGYKCPGCGSQRAIHYLLNFEIGAAARENLLLVIFIPYIIVGAFLDTFRDKNSNFQKFHDKFYGGIAIWIVFAVIILFWIGRNL